MASGNSGKRSGLGRGLGALITKTDADSATANPDSGRSRSEPGQPEADGPNSGPDAQPSGNLESGNNEPGNLESGNHASSNHASGGVLRVPVAAITPNPHQPRTEFDQNALEELASSIREHGIIQPLIVTQAGDAPAAPGQPAYWLVAGERRWRAAQLAELTVAPVIVREATERQLMELALIENIQREDLNALEEAAAYQALMDEYSLTQAEVAERVGKSRSAVANAVRLLHLSSNVQAALLATQISSGHARALLGLIDDDKMDNALAEIISGQLNVRQTEALVKMLLETEEETLSHAVDDQGFDPMANHWRGVEDRFRNALGTKVALNRNANGAGRLVVHFYNDDDLDSLLRHIAGDEDVL